MYSVRTAHWMFSFLQMQILNSRWSAPITSSSCNEGEPDSGNNVHLEKRVLEATADWRNHDPFLASEGHRRRIILLRNHFMSNRKSFSTWKSWAPLPRYVLVFVVAVFSYGWGALLRQSILLAVIPRYHRTRNVENSASGAALSSPFGRFRYRH